MLSITRENNVITVSGSAKSGAISAKLVFKSDLQRVIEHLNKIWPGLNAEARAGVMSGLGMLVESETNEGSR